MSRFNAYRRQRQQRQRFIFGRADVRIGGKSNAGKCVLCGPAGNSKGSSQRGNAGRAVVESKAMTLCPSEKSDFPKLMPAMEFTR